MIRRFVCDTCKSLVVLRDNHLEYEGCPGRGCKGHLVPVGERRNTDTRPSPQPQVGAQHY